MAKQDVKIVTLLSLKSRFYEHKKGKDYVEFLPHIRGFGY